MKDISNDEMITPNNDLYHQQKLDSLNSQNSMRTHYFESSSHIMSAEMKKGNNSLQLDRMDNLDAINNIFSQEVDVKLLSSYQMSKHEQGNDI